MSKRIPTGVREIEKTLTREGWTRQGADGRGHFLYLHIESGEKLRVSGSPGDWRNHKNTIADARRKVAGRYSSMVKGAQRCA